MSAKRTGGLARNPLLTRTDGPEATPAIPVETPVPAGAQSPATVQPAAATQKFTFYFTEEQLERLDDVWERLRRDSRRSKQRVSKSLFVRVALDRLLEEFERDPEQVIAALKEELVR
ncbi:MAG TPA: hypothetical protein VMM78_14545 [Thermomicrobiales bacterium]|nr:hypothetical protein [Thermomicrobiales bacterium]